MEAGNAAADLIAASRRFDGPKLSDSECIDAATDVKWMPRLIASKAPWREVFLIAWQLNDLKNQARRHFGDPWDNDED